MARATTKAPAASPEPEESVAEEVALAGAPTEAVMAAIVYAGALAAENNAHTPVVDGENGGAWVLMPGKVDDHANVTVQRRFQGRVVTRSIPTNIYNGDRLREAVNTIVKEWPNGKIG